MDRVTDALTTALSALLWVLGLTIMVGSTAIIVTMDASAAAQGQRYYVAIAAILALGIIDRQMGSVMRRRLPWSIVTQPAERRYHRRSYVLLLVASLFLLGLAHYQTVGASSGLARLLGYGLALGLAPFVVAFVLNRFVRKPFERGIDFLLSAGQDTPSRTSRSWTFSFSFGRPSMSADLGRGNEPRFTLSAHQAAQYLEAWHRIQLIFEADPAEAVRRAHRLLLEISTNRGHSGAFTRDEHVVTSTLSGVGSAIDVSRGRIEEARSVQVAVQAALAGESAKPEDLARAMAEYERILKELLDG
jgi:hypothetical protein